MQLSLDTSGRLQGYQGSRIGVEQYVVLFVCSCFCCACCDVHAVRSTVLLRSLDMIIGSNNWANRVRSVCVLFDMLWRRMTGCGPTKLG